jgi:hypothetical protein
MWMFSATTTLLVAWAFLAFNIVLCAGLAFSLVELRAIILALRRVPESKTRG